MKRILLSSAPTGWKLLLLACLVAVAGTLAACDNSVDFSPTAPEWPGFTGTGTIGERSLQITGHLIFEPGACLEATVLFDGIELPGARSVCTDGGGCSELTLAAQTLSEAGHHTISFQVLAQSVTEAQYLAEGEILITRDDLALGGVHIGLGPERATLRTGDSITFDLLFED